MQPKEKGEDVNLQLLYNMKAWYLVLKSRYGAVIRDIVLQ